MYIDRARVAQLQLPLRIYTLFLTDPRPIRQLWNLWLGRSSVLSRTRWRWFILSVICYCSTKFNNSSIDTSNVRANFSRAPMSAIVIPGDRA
ncbi:hypothetical protein QUB63_10210 [Microcoleus sp. ARI1-B5]|uniref:hypothetical protein n=1 Tax=unclassified Microcoleus TaxID=2642155 RepID=UPI002FD1FE1E